MIPASFDYVRASSLAEAIGLLREDPDGTKLVAGGHTLMPALKLRLASPELLIDIGGIEEIKGIEIGEPHQDRRADHPCRTVCFRAAEKGAADLPPGGEHHRRSAGT